MSILDLKRELQRPPAGRSIEFHERVDLGAWTTLKVGGPADLLVRCTTVDAVVQAVEVLRERSLRYLILGGGSNTVVPDQGLRIPVLTLGGALATWEIDLDGALAGGGANLTQVCRAVARVGLSGMEPLFGVPGTIGGAVAMNAGAYGVELFDILEWIKVVRPGEGLTVMPAGEVDHGYRWSAVGRSSDVVVQVRLSLVPDDLASISARVRQIGEQRRGKLPPGWSAGSVFRNPGEEAAGRLLERAGCKGLSSGGARVSDRHANVIVTSRGARASDILVLARDMRGRVKDMFGVELEPEIRFLDTDGRRIEL